VAFAGENQRKRNIAVCYNPKMTHRQTDPRTKPKTERRAGKTPQHSRLTRAELAEFIDVLEIDGVHDEAAQSGDFDSDFS